MDSILNSDYSIHFTDKSYKEFNQLLEKLEPSVVFIIVDSNTLEHCYPYFASQMVTGSRIEVIELEPGEQNKDIATCMQVWQTLNELECDRKSLIVNLGGGVVTDLGGFVASTIKRGIAFVHVPTTLLGMVDAAIGGKNGVDLGPLKNQVGTINPPKCVLIDPAYLESLSMEEFRSGAVEMYKHGLISGREYWERMLKLDHANTVKVKELIYGSVYIKNDIVNQDRTEKGPRKWLNFGHTIGHAVESHCLSQDHLPNLLHGQAVAVGILGECLLSVQYAGLPGSEYEEVLTWYKRQGPQVRFRESDYDKIIALMKHDKKNVNGEVRFVLLQQIGKPVTDCVCDQSDIIKALATAADPTQ